ncbi:serine/threonine-protein kinase meng-po isoform X2 [Bactrocera neohumeralis]|uniref:serine/threonine-protein kinase meng-po isoform X2 n=1 Tax=Bactrocera neohumeralis TaxID=98809 RepID=UPI002166B2F2|nr:serine/threonine-protein kinase meng-po isoform X2 [Bactrocera neohumeralis]
MSKRPRGNIHKIREFELEKIHLVDEFDILQIVGEGWFGKILLVEHRGSQTEMVLKAVPKPYVSIRDFFREFHYGLHLGIHRNIVTTYDVAFETAGFYIFTQEYAPLGDLTSNMADTGVGEEYTKRVAKQIGAALDYMHSKDIVHRDVKLDNVLIYRSDFTRVKICDFGESYQAGTIVERRNEWLPYSPPEVLEIKPEGTYTAEPSHDVWQFGIVIFVCLTGCLPWQKAASDDPRYVRYLAWFGANILPMRRTPKLFKLITSRAQRMFKRFLDPRAERRPKNLTDLSKFLDDRWLTKTAEKEMAEYETDELCPSMYSFHSSPDEKHRLLHTLANCGLETNVDRQSKKNRIKDWIEASVITEEDEEELEDNSPSSSVSREPVAGHISSIRNTMEQTKAINTTLKDAAQKHFDPRTGALQEGPSEMGGITQTQKSYNASIGNISTMNNGDSLCGSLLTLSSRPDLLESHLEIYNSELNINRLGNADTGKGNSSVTLTGLANAFHSLASITLPKSGTPDRQQQQQQQHVQQQQEQHRQQQQQQQLRQQQFATYYLKQQENGSSIRDSAYGSAEVSEAPSRTVSTSSMKPQYNGNSTQYNGQQAQFSNHTRAMSPDTRQRPPESQQIYRGARTGSLKDSAYDRITVTNNNRNRR